MEKLFIKSVKLDKAQYHPGETVNITIVINKELENYIDDYIFVKINNLEKEFYNQMGLSSNDDNTLYTSWDIPDNINFEGFGIDIEYYNDGHLIEVYSTAFDVVEKWSQAPRYGFLADFAPGKSKEKISKTLERMKDYHLNLVQFYDWMYRHHELLPPTEEFQDIFNRTLSMSVVKEYVMCCISYGVYPIAYGAMYGAESEFVRCHPDWIAETRDGKSVNQLVGIQIMNIATDCPWLQHIVNQYEMAMNEVGFKGIHIDQYGFPKTYYSIVGNKRELKDMGIEFGNFIDYARKELGDETALIFNAVNNWPIEIVADRPQDVIYIEVWGPNDTFYHLRELILGAKKLSNYEKQVIVAAYISSLNKKRNLPQEVGERSARLTAAVIAANGGFHLVLGEGESMLTDAYYPEFRELTLDFADLMQDYYDFITRYSKYLFSIDLRDKSAFLTGGVNDEIKIRVGNKGVDFGPNGLKDFIWTIIKDNDQFKTLNLINLVGIDTIYWDEAQYNDPEIQENIEVSWLIDEDVEHIFLVTPDRGDIRPVELDYIRGSHTRGEIVKFVVPRLDYWNMIIVI